MLVIAGPSGVGKGTLIKKLINRFPDAFGLCVSQTSRSMRSGEVHGVDYFFTSREKFFDDIERGAFLEYTHACGHFYGTLISEVERVERQDKICLLEIDLEGVSHVQRTGFFTSPKADHKFVFVRPARLEDLVSRLRFRATESEEQIRLRVKQAEVELASAEKMSFDAVIVNVDLENCYAELENLVLLWYPKLSQEVSA